MIIRVQINPSRIAWAIVRSGQSVDEYASKDDEVASWLNGHRNPTVKQLEGFSKKVHVPFGYLFLPEVPEESLQFPFFRKIVSGRLSLNVLDTITRLQQRQEWLRDYLIENGFNSLQFVGKFENVRDSRAVCDNIREVLRLKENWALDFASWEAALKALSSKIEEIGIILSFNGIVDNNTTRKIPVEQCRGFVLVDEIAPFMFINNSDSPSAQMFTIVHEFSPCLGWQKCWI